MVAALVLTVLTNAVDMEGEWPEEMTAELKARMPFADLSKFETNPEVSGISNLFTVEMITRYIQGKLNEPNSNGKDDDKE